MQHVGAVNFAKMHINEMKAVHQLSLLSEILTEENNKLRKQKNALRIEAKERRKKSHPPTPQMTDE